MLCGLPSPPSHSCRSLKWHRGAPLSGRGPGSQGGEGGGGGKVCKHDGVENECCAAQAAARGFSTRTEQWLGFVREGSAAGVERGRWGLSGEEWEPKRSKESGKSQGGREGACQAEPRAGGCHCTMQTFIFKIMSFCKMRRCWLFNLSSFQKLASPLASPLVQRNTSFCVFFVNIQTQAWIRPNAAGKWKHDDFLLSFSAVIKFCENKLPNWIGVW